MRQTTDTDTDPRAAAALAVLGGEPTETVAERMGVAPALVVRWTQQFVAAGAAALQGDHGGDPSHRDRFLALVSHELRTPLAVIRGWTQTLEAMPDRAAEPGLIDAGLRAIAGHTDRLVRLATDLLDSAAVALGRLQLSISEVDLSHVVRDIAASFPGSRVTVDAPPTVVLADPDRIGQIVTNLLHDGMGRCRGTLRVGVSADDDWATLRVHVPTPPPPFEEMHALFEPFDAGTGDAHTGLSLYVCRALAVAHGGQCGVDAEDELEFWVRLPVRGPGVAARG